MKKNKKEAMNVSFLFKKKAGACPVIYSVPNPIETSDFALIVANFLKWLLAVAGSIALVMLIVGGIMYMTSSGDQNKATTAKKTVLWAIGGLVLILLSYSILEVLDIVLTKPM